MLFRLTGGKRSWGAASSTPGPALTNVWWSCLWIRVSTSAFCGHQGGANTDAQPPEGSTPRVGVKTVSMLVTFASSIGSVSTLVVLGVARDLLCRGCPPYSRVIYAHHASGEIFDCYRRPRYNALAQPLMKQWDTQKSMSLTRDTQG